MKYVIAGMIVFAGLECAAIAQEAWVGIIVFPRHPRVSWQLSKLVAAGFRCLIVFNAIGKEIQRFSPGAKGAENVHWHPFLIPEANELVVFDRSSTTLDAVDCPAARVNRSELCQRDHVQQRQSDVPGPALGKRNSGRILDGHRALQDKLHQIMDYTITSVGTTVYGFPSTSQQSLDQHRLQHSLLSERVIPRP
jgi:hypothetical protein